VSGNNFSSAITLPLAFQATQVQASPPTPASGDELIGKELCFRFIVAQLLATGGMGKVYAAHDLHYARRCAIKVSNGTRDARLVREGRIALHLQHIPGVVRTYDTNYIDGKVPFIAIEYVDGETLRQLLIRKKTLPPAQALRIAHQLAVTLGLVHQAGVVHRDLSPANVLVQESGDVKVIDFGLAHVAGEEPLTSPNTVLGTPGYMSPEQRKTHYRIGPQMDVYALGMVLFRMLAGRAAVDALDAIAAHEERRNHIRTSLDRLLEPVAEVIARATHPDPDRRIATMDAFAMALARAHDGPWLSEVAPVLAARLQISRMRRRLVWLAVIAAAFVAIFGGARLRGRARTFTATEERRHEVQEVKRANAAPPANSATHIWEDEP